MQRSSQRESMIIGLRHDFRKEEVKTHAFLMLMMNRSGAFDALDQFLESDETESNDVIADAVEVVLTQLSKLRD